GLVGSFQYNVALQKIWLDVLHPASQYIEVTKPFKLAKIDHEACKVALVNLAEAVRVVAILIKPFLPRTAETFYNAFNFATVQPGVGVNYAGAARPLCGLELEVTAPLSGGKPQPLFPRIEDQPAG